MSFDFPASPTNGQTFSPAGGPVYVWNGSAWTVVVSGYFGQVSWFATNAAPSGWLKANGALVNRTTYAALFAAIGTAFGAGDGSTTFRLPDLRGEFVRGWDDARGIDVGRAFGSAQAGALETHGHTASSGNESVDHTHSLSIYANSGNESADHSHGPAGGGSFAASVGGDWLTGAAGNVIKASGTGGRSAAHYHGTTTAGSTAGRSVGHTHAITVADYAGAAETRPRNVALLACIKY